MLTAFADGSTPNFSYYVDGSLNCTQLIMTFSNNYSFIVPPYRLDGMEDIKSSRKMWKDNSGLQKRGNFPISVIILSMMQWCTPSVYCHPRSSENIISKNTKMLIIASWHLITAWIESRISEAIVKTLFSWW